MFTQKLSILRYIRNILLLLILIAIFLVYFLYMREYIAQEEICAHNLYIKEWIQEHFLFSLLIYIGIYSISVALALPGMVLVLTLSAGLFFGVILGLLLALFSGTLGSLLCLLAIRFFFRSWALCHYGAQIKRVNQAIAHKEYLYLIIARILPIVPYFIINIASAISNISLVLFIITFLVGSLPETLLYVWLGSYACLVPSIWYAIHVLLPIWALMIIILLFYDMWWRDAPPA